MMSCLMMILSDFMLCLRNVIISKYFLKQNSKINIIAVQNVSNFFTAVPLMIVFIHVANNGFDFMLRDLVYGII